MSSGWIDQFSVTAPAAPGNNATVKLLDTTTMFGETWSKVIPSMGLSRVVVAFLSVNQASAANGLKAYSSSNGGTNWDQIELGTNVPASVAGSTQQEDLVIDLFDDFKLEYTAGATGPTTWRVTIKVICGQRMKTS